MNQHEIIDVLIEQGWQQDRYGNLQKSFDNEKGTDTYRIKFQAISVRFEVKVVHAATEYSKATSSWVKLNGAYYKDVALTEDGRVRIGKKVLKKP